jgi:hypothetical protein
MAGRGSAWHRLVMAFNRHRPVSSVMACAHDGFHAIRTSYDHRSGVLVYFWACEHCGTRLGDARRERYRPSYDPHGNDRFLTSQAA